MSPRVRAGRVSAAVLVLIAAVFLSGRGTALASHQFTDVPNSAGYHDFVDFLVQNGLTSGCGGGLYCGGNSVTRGQMAIFLKKLALLGGCAPDAVKVGPACVDKYEASVWWTQDAGVIQKIQLSTVTAADLTAPGALQMGTQAGVFEAFGCDPTGNGAGCKDVYAVSIPGVLPSRYLTWFQAAAAARNAGKRSRPTRSGRRPRSGHRKARVTIRAASSLRRGRRRVVSPTRGPSTWWGTSSSGWPTGCHSRARSAGAGVPSAMIASAWSGRPRVVLRAR